MSSLFSVEVHASYGEVTPETVATLSALDPAEIPAAYARWVEKRQREYRAGRHHARTALRGAGVLEPKVLRGDDGLPLFPHGFAGTITHTGRLRTWAAAVVCASPHRVGLDVEERKELAEPLMRTVLTESERAHWSRAIPLRRAGFELNEAEAGLLAFSMKEAFYKTVYPATGVFLGFHEVRVELGEEPGSFTARLAAPHPEHDREGGPAALTGRFQLTADYVACGVTWPRLSSES